VLCLTSFLYAPPALWQCCETDLNAFDGSCWDAVYTKTRCCKNAIIDSFTSDPWATFTSDPWATSGSYLYPAYPAPPIIWVGGNRRSAYGLHIDENGVTVDSRGQPLKSEVIFVRSPICYLGWKLGILARHNPARPSHTYHRSAQLHFTPLVRRTSTG
jgi:hypothetical protein